MTLTLGHWVRRIWPFARGPDGTKGNPVEGEDTTVQAEGEEDEDLVESRAQRERMRQRLREDEARLAMLEVAVDFHHGDERRGSRR